MLTAFPFHLTVLRLFAVHSLSHSLSMISSSTISGVSLLALSLLSTADAAAVNKRLAVPAGYVAAPYYPAPHGGWVQDWSQSYRKASLLVSNMTLAEKTNLTAGSGIFMG